MYVRNRIAHSATNKTPSLLLTGEKPSLKSIRVFGCVSYVLNVRGDRFDPQAVEGVLLGVLEHGIFKVLIMKKDKIYSIVESRRVAFDESRLLGSTTLMEFICEDVNYNSDWANTRPEITDDSSNSENEEACGDKDGSIQRQSSVGIDFDKEVNKLDEAIGSKTNISHEHTDSEVNEVEEECDFENRESNIDSNRNSIDSVENVITRICREVRF